MNLGLLGLPKNLVTDLLLWLVPIGAGFDWWCDESDVPKGYIVPYGQDILQSQYPRLYAKWFKNGVHKYGAGSVSNSTKAPDKRGRSSIGKDDMGGAAASRVTSGVSGITGTTLGAAGGDERLHLHAHGVTDPTHAHNQTAGTGSGYSIEPVISGAYSGTAPSGIATSGAATGISIQNAGAGSSQNMGPAIVANYIIRAG